MSERSTPFKNISICVFRMREFESIWKTKQNLMPGSMAGRTKVALLKASSSKLSSSFLFFFTSF